MDLESMVAGGGIAGVIGAGITAIVKLVGSRTERAEASSMDSTAGERAAAIALEALAVERDEVHALRSEMATITGHMTALREEHARCPSQDEYDRLSREVRDARRLMDGLRSDSTIPPDSSITGAHVRAALEETP